MRYDGEKLLIPRVKYNIGYGSNEHILENSEDYFFELYKILCKEIICKIELMGEESIKIETTEHIIHLKCIGEENYRYIELEMTKHNKKYEPYFYLPVLDISFNNRKGAYWYGDKITINKEYIILIEDEDEYGHANIYREKC